MKKSFYIILTIVATFVVLYLQGYWIGKSYRLIEGQLARQLHESFFHATETYEADTTQSVSYLFRKELDESGLEKVNFRLDTVGIAACHILSDKERYFGNYYSLFKENKTFLYPISENRGIQVCITNPRAGSLGKMLYYSFSTIIALIILVIGILKQIKIINKQNEMAQVREDFSYAMIHDMKTPLSSILMGARILHSGKLDDKPEKKEKHFRIVEEEAQHLLALTNKILTISKLEHQQLVLEKKPVQLHPMLEDLAEKFSLKAGKNVTFSFQLDEETVPADEEYLKEAISNLIDNAIKYSREKVEIKISSNLYKNYIQIKVHDNGIGIPLAEQNRIFDKFERATAIRKNSKRGVSGFGLGLNYVMNVTKAQGGYVSVESVEGKFSEFTISLPQTDNSIQKG